MAPSTSASWAESEAPVQAMTWATSTSIDRARLDDADRLCQRSHHDRRHCVRPGRSAPGARDRHRRDLGSIEFPSPGAIIRIDADGSQTTLASDGIEFPLGMAVAKDGSIYASNYGVLPATGSPIPSRERRGSYGLPTRTPAGQLGANLGGYRLAAADGGVFNYGAFRVLRVSGSSISQSSESSSNPVGPGYWPRGRRRRIFDYGATEFYGSTVA